VNIYIYFIYANYAPRYNIECEIGCNAANPTDLKSSTPSNWYSVRTSDQYIFIYSQIFFEFFFKIFNFNCTHYENISRIMIYTRMTGGSAGKGERRTGSGGFTWGRIFIP
jgi:hypothetical protein